MSSDKPIKSRPIWFWPISALILFHVVAVVVPPLSFSASAPNELGLLPQSAFTGMRRYIDLLHLNHGYAFFAPDPSDSFILRYEAKFNDGRPPIAGWLPDLQDHWPRLLYHRHFMLADQLNIAFVPTAMPPELREPPPKPTDPAELAEWKITFQLWKAAVDDWKASRQRYELRRNSVIEHLRVSTGADDIKLIRVRHPQPDLLIFQQNPLPLNRPESYIDQSEDYFGDAPAANSNDDDAELILPPGEGS